MSTLVVAVIGSVTTLVVALTGQNNDQQKSADEFRRTQQQSTYSEFINRVNSFYDVDNLFWTAASAEGQYPTNPYLAKTRAEGWDALVKVRAQMPMIQLVASQDTMVAADAVQRQVFDLHRKMTNSKAEPSSPSYDADVRSMQGQLQLQLQQFVQKARADLDARH